MPKRDSDNKAREAYFEKKDEVVAAYQAATPEQREKAIENMRFSFTTQKPELIRAVVNGLWIENPPLSKGAIARSLGINTTSVTNNEMKIVQYLSNRLDILSSKNK